MRRWTIIGTPIRARRWSQTRPIFGNALDSGLDREVRRDTQDTDQGDQEKKSVSGTTVPITTVAFPEVVHVVSWWERRE
jgi:hypothetical protein